MPLQRIPGAMVSDSTITGADVQDGSLTAGDLAPLARGRILQVVQGTTNTQVIVSSTTFTDTGLSASITPLSTASRILILVDQMSEAYRASSSVYFGLRLLRGSTVIHEPMTDGDGPFSDGITATGATYAGYYTRANLTFIDSPNTISAITYKTQGRPYQITNSGAVAFQPSYTPTAGRSFLTLMEVAT